MPNHPTIPPVPLIVQDPIRGSLLNFRPLMVLLHQEYRGDKDFLVEALEDLQEYLQTVVTTDDSAARLRKMLRITGGLASAIDSIEQILPPMY